MTNTMSKIFSIPELRSFLEAVDAYEIHVFPYGYDDGETSEDPIKQIFGAEEAVAWIMDNPSYSVWGEMTGYMIVAFDHSRNYADTAIF